MCSMQLGTPTILTPRKVGDLEGIFFVADYQRGYRWGEDEVRRLLDDIKEACAAEYYLQPVVVKPLESGRWELVDGQQRLTTLYLILRIIKNFLPELELRYTLTYETRPDQEAKPIWMTLKRRQAWTTLTTSTCIEPSPSCRHGSRISRTRPPPPSTSTRR
ncbi:MAG: DUF262 domain-containing protein [Acidimicrobiia bacterium]|nr:DUF262 domain-containing protein [Acidimicrobiia bacterium]